MTREEAIRILASSCIPGSKQTEALETLIPELSESEDERIRKEMIGMINECTNWAHKKEYVKYLEKQKENPKTADSIPSNCTSCAKCEDRWHKVTDSLPDNGRLVLAKDCLGNVLLARYDGENWEVDVYDNEDHYCHNSISKWCEIPSEKQKEQKPTESISQLTVQGKGVYKICPRCKERMVRDDSMVYTSMPPQYRYECPKCGESECDTVMYDNPEMEEQKPAKKHDIVTQLKEHFANTPKEQLEAEWKELEHWNNIGPTVEEYFHRIKPAEWSEEDEDMIQDIIASIDTNIAASDFHEMEDWLKSLRPSWKPSEDELAKKHLDGYCMGREDTMREMKDFIESHFNTQSGTSTLKADG